MPDFFAKSTILLMYVRLGIPESLLDMATPFPCVTPSVTQVISEINYMNLEGIDALLSVSPFYNKPTQEGIYHHYRLIAEASPIPVILYNVPGRTSSNISAETTVRLAKDFGNIVAIKEASGNLDQITDILINRPDGFQVISGDDNLTLHMMLLGAEGVISVSGQGVPEIFCKLVNAALEGDFYTAREAHLALFDLTNLLFAEGNPAGIKALLKLRGVCGDTVRLPLVSASANLTEQLQTSLSGLEI